MLHVDINLKFLSSAPVFVSRSRSVTPTMPEENENKEEEPDSTSGQSKFFFGGWGGGCIPSFLKFEMEW